MFFLTTIGRMRRFAVPAFCLLLGLGSGIVLAPLTRSVGETLAGASHMDVRQKDHRGASLTSPLLECAELPNTLKDTPLGDLKKQVQSLVDNSQKSGDISYASVYFRDLSNGPWFGINESDKFSPASLLKVPLAMSFFWNADADLKQLDKKITYHKGSEAVEAQPFEPRRNVEDGKQYSVRALIEFMLQESSNEAAETLANLAGTDQITSTYQDLGLDPPKFGADYLIDTHGYASFFRVLYNASYLSRSASEDVLKILTNSDFSDGLEAGVPKGVVVAHKFGSRQIDASGNTMQLHDCGIVYAPDKPYILCVMTQGHDFLKLAGVIKKVSTAVYAAVTISN